MPRASNAVGTEGFVNGMITCIEEFITLILFIVLIPSYGLLNIQLKLGLFSNEITNYSNANPTMTGDCGVFNFSALVTGSFWKTFYTVQNENTRFQISPAWA